VKLPGRISGIFLAIIVMVLRHCGIKFYRRSVIQYLDPVLEEAKLLPRKRHLRLPPVDKNGEVMI